MGKKLGARVRKARLRRGLTLTALAEVIGVRSPATVWRYENGRRPEPDVLARLALALGVSAEDLAR